MAVLATAIWRVRPSGSNTNGGGYDASIPGAGTDYSQQNSAQASGTAGTAAGTTAFSDTVAAAFTAAMVGNALYLTGTGLTTGFYFCTAYIDASHITIDRSPGTGTVGTWHLGGGWADPFVNVASTGPMVPGNTCYVLGSGVPNPASYVYDYSHSGNTTIASGNNTAGFVKIVGDPANGTGVYPTIQINGILYLNAGAVFISKLWIVMSGTSNTRCLDPNGSGAFTIRDLVYDQFGYDVSFCLNAFIVTGCELFSSVTPGSSGSNVMVSTASSGQDACIAGNNIHDTVGPGILGQIGSCICENILSKCRGDSVSITASGTIVTIVSGNTIDGRSSGGGHGISISSQNGLQNSIVNNNIISNIATSGKYGITVGAGTTAANDRVKAFVDYNTFYNNTNNYNAVSAGAHDVAAGVSPYGAGTENYAPTTALYGTGWPSTFTQAISGDTTNATSVTPGAITPAASGGATYVINKITNFYIGDQDGA